MRLIKQTYDVVTPEIAAEGDFAERGWIDEEGAEIVPDSYDIEEQEIDDLEQAESAAAVKLACKHITQHGCVEPSAWPRWSPGTGHINGREYCWDCCNRLEREAMAKADKYTAYLSSDGKSLTTWPGGELARVDSLRASVHGFCGELLRFWATAPDGSRWYGTSPGRGMYARLRRAKAE